jgi:transposase-like protein
MDPASVFCPNLECPARGQASQGNIRIHSRKDTRFLCTACRKTFAATKGTALYCLRTSATTVTLVVTLLAHGCPLRPYTNIRVTRGKVAHANCRHATALY